MGRRLALIASAVVFLMASCADAPADDPVEGNPEEPPAQVETMETSPVDSLHGHLAYPETDQPLAAAGRYRETGRVVQLRTEAATAFQAMQRAAREAGVELVPISGYRTKGYQDGLFTRAIGKYGSAEAAARWVAPPGYSEHHSGLALDIGALASPELDVETAFEDTPEFAWLRDNARRYGFEISFPRDNPQGVSYEPWHWRYIGVPRTDTP